jgi:hypothetical protein
MLLEELGIAFDGLQQFGPFLRCDLEGIPLLEIVVLFCGEGVSVSGLPAVPRTLYIIPFHYFFASVEHVGHDDKIKPACFLACLVLFYYLVQSEELGDQGIRVLVDVEVVVFEDGPQKLILPIAYGLEHILPIGSVVEEGATLALTGQRGHRAHLAHHQRGHQFVGTDAVDVLLVVDFEYFADVVEGVGGVVGEGVYG